MDFNVTECKKFTSTVSDFLLKLNFKKIPLIKFLYSIEGKYSQLSLEAIKVLLLFPNFTFV